jgi:hypothetical protein
MFLQNAEELLKYDRNVWETVQSAPQQQQGAMRSVVEQPRDAKDNVLTSPVGSAPKTPGHTGHNRAPEKVETGTKPFGEGVQPRISDNTAHDKSEQAAVTNVFEWSTDYRDNYKKAYGAIRV